MREDYIFASSERKYVNCNPLVAYKKFIIRIYPSFVAGVLSDL
jgi:hypothetical protein